MSKYDSTTSLSPDGVSINHTSSADNDGQPKLKPKASNQRRHRTALMVPLVRRNVRRNQMKFFYIATLAIGVYLGILLQGATIVWERDAGAAKVLSQHPEQWDISLEGDLQTKYGQMRNLKQDVVVALTKRAGYRKERYNEWFLQGIIIIFFSVVGLVREKKTKNMRSVVEPSAPSNPHSPSAQGAGGC